MRRNLDTVLDECLAALRDGGSVSACLTRYPEHAEELRPLLATIGEVGRVLTPPSSSAARAAGQRQMLAALAARNARQARTPAILLGLRQLFGTFFGGLRPAWNLVAVAVAILFVATSGVTVAASADALPGDALYSVKLVSQKAQLAFILNPVRQGLMQDQFNNQQRMDVQAVLTGGRQETVEFEGVLQRMDGRLWVVGGLSVTVQESTSISGEPQLGMVVRVRGELPGDGSLLATKVTVDSSTEPWIADTVEPTDTVEPAGMPEPAETPDSDETVEPTETPETVDPARSDQASETLEPVDDDDLDGPKWDETAEASETAETPDPVETHEPVETPEAEHEAEPSETPDLDDESDSSDDAAETPEADGDDDSSDHRDSADTPEATDEPDEDDGSDDDDESDDDNDDSSDVPDSDDPPDEDDDPEDPDD